MRLSSGPNPSVVRRIVACYCAALVSSGCGVREHPHPKPKLEASNDFAPIPGDSLADNKHEASPRGAGMDAADASNVAAAGERDAATQVGAEPAADSGTASRPAVVGQSSAEGGSGGRTAADGGPGGAMESTALPDAGVVAVEPIAPTPPPEMPAIVLGGVPLRKEDVLAVIHFGHSNMGGIGSEPPELRPYFFSETHPRVWMYHVGAPPKLALEPTVYPPLDWTGGPGLPLLKQAAELAPDKYFMSLGYAHGGASCIHFTPGWAYFEPLIESAVAIKDRVTFAAIVVMLGSIESLDDGRAANALPDCFVKLASAVREAVGRPDLPLLFSDFEVEAYGMFSSDGVGPQKVMAELAKVPGLVSNSAIVPTDGCAMQDDHHFNLAGNMLWTRRVLDIMLAKGWFPWATMPANP